MFLLFHRGIFRFQPLVVCRSKNSALHQHVPFKLSLVQHKESCFFTSSYDMELHHKVFSTAYHWWTISKFGIPILLVVGIVASTRVVSTVNFRNSSVSEGGLCLKLSLWLSHAFSRPLGSHMNRSVWLIHRVVVCFKHFLDVCFTHCYTKSWDVNHHSSSRVASPWITLMLSGKGCPWKMNGLFLCNDSVQIVDQNLFEWRFSWGNPFQNEKFPFFGWGGMGAGSSKFLLNPGKMVICDNFLPKSGQVQLLSHWMLFGA